MFKDENRHYSLRKLSVGLASVLIGISFASGNSHTVKADTVKDGSNSTQTVVQTTTKGSNTVVEGRDAAAEANAKDGANTVAKVNAESTPKEQSQTSEVVKKNSDAITQDIRQKAVKASEAVTKVQNNTVKDNSDETALNVKGRKTTATNILKEGKTEVKENQGWTDPAKNKLQMSTVRSTTSKRLNAKLLAVSKVVSQANDTNGGFDEATWGKLNVNDWQGSVQGDYYQLTDYTGDANHVIVPNEADFDKAGISTSGKQVGVTSSLMHAIFKDKATTQDATVAFSKTDNKMVKAIDNDWHDTWAHVSYHGVKAELSKFNGTNLDVSNVTNMNSMFRGNQISDLGSLADWKVDHVTDMGLMFAENQISDLDPLANWKVDHVTNMGGMFMDNQISDISSLANWSVSQVPRTRMLLMFDDNSSSIQTNTVQAKRIINFVYPASYTGKKQDSITQIVDVPQKVNAVLATKAPKPSDNILDWVTKTETPETPDPVYFQDYTVPEIKGLLVPDKTVISRQQADTTKPINVTVTYKLVESNTNDAFALDPKNGLHEHADVNDNGGYDADYWGKLDINDWNYTTNGNVIAITGYKGNNPSSLIIPNGADFDFINGQNNSNSRVEISSSVMHNLAKNATRIGLSKTANNKIAASDADWQNAFGGQTNESGTTSNANGGIKYGSPNLTQMDLHNLDTSAITDMVALFNGGSNLTTVGDLSDWNTSNVTTMRIMFQEASGLTNIGNLDNWDTSKVTDMGWMFNNTTSLTNIGDLSKWKTGNVTNMHSMFANVTNLTNIGNLDNWNTNKVTDMSWMFGTDFGKQSHLTNIGDLSKWQTGNVTDMHSMFANATNLTNIGNLSKWQTDNVTDMSLMFGTESGKQSHLTNIGNLSKWQTGNVTDMSYMFINANALHNLNISNWNLTKLPDKNAMQYMFANDANLTVIANDLKLPAWYQNEINDANYFWNNHMAVITNVPELIRATGDINNLKIDDQDASRSIFYDSKGSSDAIQVLKDANQAYINKYEQDHPKYLLALDANVDQTDPIALANARFKTSHKIIDVVQTNHATRTIIVHLPNGTMQTIVQTIGLKRNAQKDLVIEVTSSTASWGLDEANSSYTINGVQQTQTAYKPNSNIITFSSIKLPKVPGYKAKVTRNNGLLMVNYLVFAPEKPTTNNTLNELQFNNKLVTDSAVQFNSTIKSNIVVKSDMYQVVNNDHNWQLPVIKSYDLKFATNKNQIIFAYTKDKQYNYRFVLTFKDGQYRLTTFNKQGKLLKTYSIKSYKTLAKIIHSLVSMNIA